MNARFVRQLRCILAVESAPLVASGYVFAQGGVATPPRSRRFRASTILNANDCSPLGAAKRSLESKQNRLLERACRLVADASLLVLAKGSGPLESSARGNCPMRREKEIAVDRQTRTVRTPSACCS